jgi:hypothetical protein
MPSGRHKLKELVTGTALVVVTVVSAADFCAFPSDAACDEWLAKTSATYASLVADIRSRPDIRGYRFVTTNAVKRGMAAWNDGYLEVQLNPSLKGPDRITTLIFEIANVARFREHQQIDLAVDQGLITTSDEFGLANELIEYEALRLHRQVLIEIEAAAGALPKAFFYFYVPTPPSARESQLPGLYPYLKTQRETGHTAHYDVYFRLRKKARLESVASGGGGSPVTNNLTH